MRSLPFLLLCLALPASSVQTPSRPAKKAAAKEQPSAAAQEEAERRMARGAAGVRTAASPAELKEAAAEFEAAAAAVPALADAYYNAGVTYAKAGEHAAAVRNLKRYVELAKGADLKAAKAKLAEEEFLLEKAAKAAREPFKALEGDWYQLDPGKTKANAATWDDYGRHWSLKSYPGGAQLWISHERFNGQVRMYPPESAGITLTATIKDGVATWEGTDRYGECGSAHTAPARVSIQDGGAVIDIRFEQLMPRRALQIEGDNLRNKGVAFMNFDAACVVGQNYPYRLGRGE